VTRDGLVQ